MKLYNLVITNKSTGEKSILDHNLPGDMAEQICEIWDWTYCDDKYSYYMSAEESPVTEEMHDVIVNSFLHDLHDALEVETDPSIIERIMTEIERRAIQ